MELSLLLLCKCSLKKHETISHLLLVFPFVIHGLAQSHWQIKIMPQAVFGTKNTVQRPNNNEGTRFSLNNDFNRKKSAFFSPRFEIEYNYKRHHIIATAALLTNKFDGTAPFDIHYNGMLFNSGSYIDAVYQFNTYRLGYRYRFVENNRLNFEFGATLLLRDAYISLEDNSGKTSFENVGVAPLLSYYIEWLVAERISLLSYGDAFAVKAGRAEDVFIGAKYRFTPMVSALAGYRLLEGGSDGDRVYTMSAFHFISVGLNIEF